MNIYKTNQIEQKKLLSRENFKSISKDFWICKFIIDQKKSIYNYDLIDEVKQKLQHVESVVYLKGATFFALFKKINFNNNQSALEEAIEELVSDKEKVNWFIITNIRDYNVINKRHLVQLLFNSLPLYSDDNKPQQANITGGLYVIAKVKKGKKKEGKKRIVWQYITIKIELDFHFHLTLNVKTFSSVALRAEINFSERRTQFKDHPQYAILNNNLRTIRRVKFDDKSISYDKKYINAVPIGEKNTLTYMDFGSFERFKKTKAGILYNFLKEANKRLKSYLTIEFKPLPFDRERISYDNKAAKQVKNKIKNFYHNRPIIINIADSLKRETSAIQLANNIKIFLEDKERIYKAPNNVVLGDIDKDGINFRIIRDKEYYEANGLEDEYLKGNLIIHHLTLKNFNLEMFRTSLDKKTQERKKEPLKKSAAIDVLLKESYIKMDVLSKLITIIDWNLGEWIFMSHTKSKEEATNWKEKKYDFQILEVSETGKLHYFNCKHGNDFDNLVFNQLKIVYQSSLKNSWKTKEDPECMVVSSSGDINMILKTPKKTIQEVEEIGDALHQESSFRNFNQLEVLSLIQRFQDQEELNEKDKINFQELLKLVKKGKKTFDKPYFISLIKKAKVNFRGGNHAQYRFSQFYQKETGDVLRTFFRGEDKEDLLGSKLDIYYSKINQKAAYYFVGEKSKGIQSTFQNATLIRRVEALPRLDMKSSELVFHHLLNTMSVDFVKHGQFTAIPFPFKYLRESHRLEE